MMKVIQRENGGQILSINPVMANMYNEPRKGAETRSIFRVTRQLRMEICTEM